VLAVLCLTMLLAGLGSVGGALSEQKKVRAEHRRLTDRIEEYRLVCDALSGKISYREADQALKEEQEAHDEQASQHRMDLAIYTATRSGIRSGVRALYQAGEALEQGRAQYEEGLRLFEEQEAAFWEGYRQFQEGKQQLQAARNTLNMIQEAISGVRSQLEQCRAMGDLLDSEDENARQEMSLAAFDSMLQSLDQAIGLYEALKDQGGVSPEQMQMLKAMLAQQEDVDLSEVPDEVWNGISEESLQEFENSVVQSTGMTVGEIRASIQQMRDGIAAMDPDATLSEEEYLLLQAAYRQNREQIWAVLDAMEAKLNEYEAQLSAAQAQLNAAQAQMDAMEPVMEQGRVAMEQGRAALEEAGAQLDLGQQGLANGRWQIWQKQQELEEQAEALRQEKLELDAQAEELNDKAAETQELKALEQREASIRLMLLEKEGIQTRSDEGMELLDAAEDYAAELLREDQRMTDGRLLASALMVLGALAGFAGIPAAFEKTKIRFWLIAPVLLCLCCAVGAETVCRVLGRGDSYSALGTAVFAAVQLALVIPRKKASA
jgi:chromosome segregation ATPase